MTNVKQNYNEIPKSTFFNVENVHAANLNKKKKNCQEIRKTNEIEQLVSFSCVCQTKY